MRRSFAEAVLQQELAGGALRLDSSIVAVCAGQDDQRLFADLGFTDVSLTNVDVTSGNAFHGEAVATEGWSQADAQNMPYADGEFDFAFVSDGLHHCRAPHRAVTEMFRVSRRGIIVIESRDSLAMRGAIRAGLSGRYEFNDRLLTTREHGGVDFGPVPNFVYRWSEREFEKLVRTFNPENDQEFVYYYGLDLPPRLRRNPLVRASARALTAVAPRQGNTFAMVAHKAGLKPYLHLIGSHPKLREEITGANGHPSTGSMRRRRHRVAPEH